MSEDLPTIQTIILNLHSPNCTRSQIVDAIESWKREIYGNKYQGPSGPAPTNLDEFVAIMDGLMLWLDDQHKEVPVKAENLADFKEVHLQWYDLAPDQQMARRSDWDLHRRRAEGTLNRLTKWLSGDKSDSSDNSQKRTMNNSGNPKSYLLNWPDILEALGLPNRKQSRSKVTKLNDQFKGPINMPSKGGQPTVERNTLIEWWNSLEERFQESKQNQVDSEEELKQWQADADGTLQARHNYGKDSTVLPEISGQERKRRRKKSK